MRRRRIGEFELIARYFAPLAKSFPGAGGLLSDNAFLPSDPRRDLVVKTDTIVAGVHFLADEKPDPPVPGEGAQEVGVSHASGGS